MNRKRRKQKRKRYWIEQGARIRWVREFNMDYCVSAWREALLNAGQKVGTVRRAWMVNGEVLDVSSMTVYRESVMFKPDKPYSEWCDATPGSLVTHTTAHQLKTWACARCGRSWLAEDGARVRHSCHSGQHHIQPNIGDRR